jgi:hypothetical protein
MTRLARATLESGRRLRRSRSRMTRPRLKPMACSKRSRFAVTSGRKHYAAEEYIALLNTFSGHIAMEAAKRDHLYREIRTRTGHRPNPRGCGATGARSFTWHVAKSRRLPSLGVCSRDQASSPLPAPRITEALAPSWTERQQRLEAALCSGRARAACS